MMPLKAAGPAPVTGEAAAQWIADEMKRIGLKPGNHGSYFQNGAGGQYRPWIRRKSKL